MKALTVWQPWASLIAIGAKPYEFRGWPPPKGIVGKRIAIHAGARRVRLEEVRALIRALRGDARFAPPCLISGIALPALERVAAGLRIDASAVVLPHAHIVCTAVVGSPKSGADCVIEFAEGAGNDSDRHGHFNWGWPMLDVKPVAPPVPIRGAQGLWNAPDVEGARP